jgi:hypothetical protein
MQNDCNEMIERNDACLKTLSKKKKKSVYFFKIIICYYEYMTIIIYFCFIKEGEIK